MKNSDVDKQIQDVLGSVSHQIRRGNTIQAATFGLAVGCGVAAVLALVHALAPEVSLLWILVALVAGAVGGAMIGFLTPVPLAAAAQRVDEYYVLKDRAITALQFSAEDNDPLRSMQVVDAARHLRQVRPDDCVAIEPPRGTLASAGFFACIALLVILVVKFNSRDAVASAPMPLAVNQASMLRETMLPEVEELLQETPELEELEELNAKLEELVEELEQEGIDEHDLMATLSEMELAIAAAHEAMKLELAEAQLQSLAAAMKPSEAMQMAAAAMEEGEYDKASERLEAVDPTKIGDKERRAVADNLKKFLAKLSPGQQGQLSDAAQLLQEGLQEKNDSMCKDGMCKLARICKKQGNCKKVGKCMACQLNLLAQCKSQCRGSCNGGNSSNQSDSPSQKWGKGATGNPKGDPTNLASSRQQEKLDSQFGDGPSESEILQAPEGEQSAARAYARKYQKFRTQAEAVLDSEPLPIGHRVTVREYFESIRPDNQQSAEVDK